MPRPQTLVFLGLNAVRVLSIVGLLLVFSSSIVVMVTNIKAVNRFQANRISNSTNDMLDCDYIEGSTVPNQPAGVFWAVVATLLIIFQVIILLLSELSWPMVFFDRFFPVLGSNFGLGALGIFQALIGAQILSHHVDDFTLVAAFFLFSIGCLNMFLGLIFREGAKAKRSLRGKREAEKNAKAGIITGQIRPHVLDVTPQFTIPAFPGAGMGDASPMEKPIDAESFHSWRSTDKAGYGFGRQGEKVAGLRGFILQRPEETLPRYASPSPSFTAAAARSSNEMPIPARDLAPSPSRVPRRASPPRSASSRSSSRDSASSRSSEYSHHSSSSFASPMSYRETIHTIQIPDSPVAATPPPFLATMAPSNKYGRPRPTAF
ncbi:hypothetical protein MIND_01102100 [Mycena indigotica]|uniref:DUF7598 domain-containing protein n=1 Tax=Mycena indigotica TaxID=2126181 RepID=A0A8H6SBB9_9AGAR|nr:uncharacterized protein MIND_01102100 [Mycena indigotica]KAF7295620.1 hypothetical protein MIND_01102100 [Mycena indigotica]